MQKEIQNIIKESSEDVSEMVKANLKEELVNSLTWNVREEASKIVQDFFENELKEEIKLALDQAKPELKKELEKAVVNVAAEAGKRLLETATENLSNSYQVGKLAENLFR